MSPGGGDTKSVSSRSRACVFCMRYRSRANVVSRNCARRFPRICSALYCTSKSRTSSRADCLPIRSLWGSIFVLSCAGVQVAKNPTQQRGDIFFQDDGGTVGARGTSTDAASTRVDPHRGSSTPRCRSRSPRTPPRVWFPRRAPPTRAPRSGPRLLDRPRRRARPEARPW